MIEETRILLKNAGRIDPESIDDYLQAGGYKGLQKALDMEPVKVISVAAQ